MSLNEHIAVVEKQLCGSCNECDNVRALIETFKAKMNVADCSLRFTLDNIDEEQRKEIVGEALKLLHQ